MTSIDDQEEF